MVASQERCRAGVGEYGSVMTTSQYADLDYPDANLRIVVSSDIELRLRANACQKEQETSSWLGTLLGGECFFDCGANVGSYSLIAASRSVWTFAFEPFYPTFAHLLENIRLNHLEIEAFPIGFGARDQVAFLKPSSSEPGSAEHAWSESDGIPVLSMRMDTFASWRGVWPSALKIDVDGEEIKVLQGATSCLARCRTVLIETCPETERKCSSILHAAGLRQADVYPHKSGVANEIWVR